MIETRRMTTKTERNRPAGKLKKQTNEKEQKLKDTTTKLNREMPTEIDNGFSADKANYIFYIKFLV